MEKEINFGVIEKGPEGMDWVAGGESGITFIKRMPDAAWKRFLPEGELQKSSKTDFMDCVTQSALNEVEAQMNWLVTTGAFTREQMNWFIEQGYLANNKFSFSKRFTAKMSGTTTLGNSATAVWDSIRNHGLLPESDWPVGKNMSWDEHYSEIPQDLVKKAQKMSKTGGLIEAKYEFVYYRGAEDVKALIKQHLKQSPLQILAPVCSPWNIEGVVAACGLVKPQHATTIYAYEDLQFFNDFDHYIPFDKKLAWNYPIPYVVKGVVEIKKDAAIPGKFTHVFSMTLKYGQSSPEITLLQDALKIDGVFPKNVNSTGYYGKITAAAVLAFQRKYKVDSEEALTELAGKQVGPRTIKKLNELYAR